MKWYNDQLTNCYQFSDNSTTDYDNEAHGSGGGTSGRATAFCLGVPGLNPGMDLGFFQFRIAVNLFSLGVRVFLIMRNRTLRTLPSSFLFLIFIYLCKIYQF